MPDFLQLSGKTFVVFGVANRKSVAWFVGRSLEAEGARVVYSVRSEARLRRGERFRAASEAPPRERRKLRHEQAAAAADEERFPIADGRIERFRRPRYREPRKHRRLLPDLRLELLSSHRPGLSPQLARTLDESRGA